MAKRIKKPWLAKWQRVWHRMILGGEYVVTLHAVIVEPGSSEGREVEIQFTPEMAEHVADCLWRTAERMREYNDRLAPRPEGQVAQ